jgi:hypothetical protein
MMSLDLRVIAFYLPQFHPIPENDEWWGLGFTEWRNVAKATPLFPGHYQPHLPADLGFYDLRLPEAREAQVELARRYGIHGFCYYHYWFNGRRILERPFNEVVASGKPDFPFCLCWANENWTRRWDGNDQQVLLSQNYSFADDLQHIQSLIPAFSDPRYIKIDGKPLFLVYRAELMPDPHRTIAIWRDAVERAGFKGIYLARVESFNSVSNGITAPILGFDADVEFPPFSWNLGGIKFRDRLSTFFSTLGLLPGAFMQHQIIDYDRMLSGMIAREPVSWTRFRCVTPSWDNTARRQEGGYVFHGSTPEKYQAWLSRAVRDTVQDRIGDERILFINAWNEWAEGNHLEPDLRWGRAYLEATKVALGVAERDLRPATLTSGLGAQSAKELHTTETPLSATGDSTVRRLYWRVRRKLAMMREMFSYVSFPWK